MFDIKPERIETAALKLDFHIAPWDRPAFGADTAVLADIEIADEASAHLDFARFRQWCHERQICLVACRLDQARLGAIGFLEAEGFRYIELNYRPYCTTLGRFTADPGIQIVQADPGDRDHVAAIAGRIFAAGRLQVDPMVANAIGDRRYALWASNAFDHPQQNVIKCLLDDEIAAFMVIEASEPHKRFWSLVGLAPGLGGRGLGRRIWEHVLAWHHSEAVTEVATKISSHNIAVHNLYSSLGFRFPAPAVTLHWCPTGPVGDPLEASN
jgi:GNAT superfamily N-acetyltransferase